MLEYGNKDKVVYSLLDTGLKLKHYLQKYDSGLGLLNKDWAMYKELPKNIRIHYEDEFIMGKARATFPKKVLDIVH